MTNAKKMLDSAIKHLGEGDFEGARMELLNASSSTQNAALAEDEVCFKQLLSMLVNYERNISSVLKAIKDGNPDTHWCVEQLEDAQRYREAAHKKAKELAKLLPDV